VDDKVFWKDRRSIGKASELPEVKDRASIYDYPVGGSSLAVTQGSVARILYDALGSEFASANRWRRQPPATAAGRPWSRTS
jgi:hypothetical protein